MEPGEVAEAVDACFLARGEEALDDISPAGAVFGLESQPRDLPPQLLVEPDVKLSLHPAPITHHSDCPGLSNEQIGMAVAARALLTTLYWLYDGALAS